MIKISANSSSKTVATGVSYGALANDQHARLAVQKALAKLPDAASAGSVILFLSCGYAHSPQNAITEAV